MAPTWLKMAQSGPRLPRSARERIRRPLNAGAWLAEAVNETRRPQNAGAQPGNEPDACRTQASGSLSQGTNQTLAERRRVARLARERNQSLQNAGAWLAQPGNEPDARTTQARGSLFDFFRTQALGSLRQGTNQTPAERIIFNDLVVVSIWGPRCGGFIWGLAFVA